MNVLRNFNRSFMTTSRKLVELTSKRYPNLKRGQYSNLKKEDLQFFEKLLGSNRVLTEDLDFYNTDWIKTVKGQSGCVLKPKTTDEVSEIMKYCNAKKLAVVPQGGNTGLVGGSTPIFDEIVLSTSLMDKIISLDLNSSIVSVQSGVILEKLDNYLNEKDLMVPYDLGAKGSCQVGGNIATNAGGIRLLRYGNLHGSVIGIEAVLASGEIINCMSENKKDNTGYDLKHLFIGSEGTLGIVTKVSLYALLNPKPLTWLF